MINIRISEDTILESLKGIIKHENKDAIVDLIHGLLIESPRGSELYIEFLLNGKYPELPKIGTVGYINIAKHYIKNKEQLMNSGLVINNYIEGIVRDIHAIHLYCPIQIEHPVIDDNGNKTTGLTSVGIDEFYTDIEDF